MVLLNGHAYFAGNSIVSVFCSFSPWQINGMMSYDFWQDLINHMPVYFLILLALCFMHLITYYALSYVSIINLDLSIRNSME